MATFELRTLRELADCKTGDVISVPGYGRTGSGLEIARITPGRFKSYLKVSFKGGYHLDISRDIVVVHHSPAAAADSARSVNADHQDLSDAAKAGFTKCPEAITGDAFSGFRVATEAGEFRVSIYIYAADPRDFRKSTLAGMDGSFQRPKVLADHTTVMDAVIAGLHKDASLAEEIIGITTDGDQNACETLFLFRGRCWSIKVRA